MKGILIIAHGSREKNTLDIMESVYKSVKKLVPNILFELAYMEFNDMTLEKGLDSLKKQGADDISVVPYFLFTGMHIKKDIPEAISDYQLKNKGLKIKMGKTLGVDDRIIAVLADRVNESL